MQISVRKASTDKCLQPHHGQRHRTCGVSTNTKDRDTAHAVSPPTQRTETPHVRCLHQHKGQRHRMCGVSINTKDRDTACAVSPSTQSTETPHMRCLHQHKAQRHRMCGVSTEQYVVEQTLTRCLRFARFSQF